MTETLDTIIDGAAEMEQRVLRAFGAIIHQERYLGCMSGGDRALYGEREELLRTTLVEQAAEALSVCGSDRVQRLVHVYLERLAEVVNGNENWGKGFSFNPIALQGEVRQAMETVCDESLRMIAAE